MALDLGAMTLQCQLLIVERNAIASDADVECTQTAWLRSTNAGLQAQLAG